VLYTPLNNAHRPLDEEIHCCTTGTLRADRELSFGIVVFIFTFSTSMNISLKHIINT